ncbi:hypothetical protein RKD26_000017 [Streptomyces calvus]
MFGDEVLAKAILGRLLHYCDVVSINGPSYRLANRLAAIDRVTAAWTAGWAGTHRTMRMPGSGDISSLSAVRTSRASCRARPHPASVVKASLVHLSTSAAWDISLKTSSIICSEGNTSRLS